MSHNPMVLYGLLQVFTFVMPVCDRLTGVCSNQNPFGSEIKDNGILTFLSDCTGYGNTVMIRSFFPLHLKHLLQ
jgi:hypothetical protein